MNVPSNTGRMPFAVAEAPLRWRVLAWRVALALLAGAALLLALRFVSKDAFRYFRWDAAHYGHYWPMRTWLLLHVAGGVVALLCGPLQLWSGVRGRTAGAHRLRGRVYVAGVLVGAAAATGITVQSPLFPALRVPLAMLTLAWVSMTALAVLAIRRGRLALHKELMVRSYVLTFTFVTFRWWMELPLFRDLGRTDRITALLWLAFTLPLLVTELILQYRRLAAPEPAFSR